MEDETAGVAINGVALIFSLVRTAFLSRILKSIWKAYENLKEQKKELSEKLIPVAWHPNRWWDWCKSEDEKKI